MAVLGRYPEEFVTARSLEPDGTPSEAPCVCGHEARKHVMTSATQRCEALIYTNAPLGGGSSYPCSCRQFTDDVPDECRCGGYPCEHVPAPAIQVTDRVGYKLAYTRPVTLAMAAELREAGLWAVADLAERYAVDRWRWWHRFRPVEGK